MAILLLITLIAYSSYIGIKIAHIFQWSTFTTHCFLPIASAVGIGMAPFLLGLPIIFSLYFFGGHSGHLHLLVLMVTLITLHGITSLLSTKQTLFIKTAPLTLFEKNISILVFVWIFFLFFNSFYYALTQNDALEYMTVAKQMFATNNLNSYPMINQDVTPSGFYGPWTHPPLFVSLLYLMHLIQGHSLFPGLSRMISPWAAFLTTMLVYSLGGFYGRMSALISALICISTPLFFLGATSSLIDSLPILGFVLTLALLVGLDSAHHSKWVFIGAIVGLALWTHSQAILLLPMIFIIICSMFGLRQWRQALNAICTVFSLTLLISIWPYIRNYFLFGALVSDNPIVFSLPNLKWDEYFDYARGLDNPIAIIQYGLFKGWFAIEALSFSFWIMTIGVFAFSKQFSFFRSIKSSIITGANLFTKPHLVLFLSLLFLLIYFCGTLVSVALGMNIMIKNERYLLIMLPFVSIIGGYGAAICIEKSKQYLNKFIYYFFATILFILLALVIFVITYSYPNKYLSKEKISLSNVFSNSLHEKFLMNFPSTGLILKAKSILPADALVLSLKPADMYYSDRKMLSYLDPRLVPFYKETDPQKGVEVLKKLGVSYIQTTDYSLPVEYNSVLNKILEDPKLAKLIISNMGNEMYQLSSSHDHFKLIKDITPGKITWSYYQVWNFMGRKGLFTQPFDLNNLSFMKHNQHLNFKQTWAFNHRNISHMLISTTLDNNRNNPFANPLSLKPNQEYRISFKLEGEGFIRFYMIELNANYKTIKYFDLISTSIKLSEIVLSKTNNTLSISKRFISQGSKIVFFIETIGSSEIYIKQAKLFELDTKNTN